MRDAEAEDARRDQMARAAAPYVHRRKKPADKKGKHKVAHEDALDWDDEIVLSGSEIAEDRPEDWVLEAWFPRKPSNETH